jgi:hypothetical protein
VDPKSDQCNKPTPHSIWTGASRTETIVDVKPSSEVLSEIREAELCLKSESLSNLQKGFLALNIYAFELAFKELVAYVTNSANTNIVRSTNHLAFYIYINDFHITVHVTYRINGTTLIAEDFYTTFGPDGDPPRPGMALGIRDDHITFFDRPLNESPFMALEDVRSKKNCPLNIGQHRISYIDNRNLFLWKNLANVITVITSPKAGKRLLEKSEEKNDYVT